MSASPSAPAMFWGIGPNGSGKSTTVKMLTGLLEPSAGEVLYRGHNINSDLVAYKRRLGYAPEEANLYTFLSGWEYLELVATLREMSAARLKEKAEAMLEDFRDVPPPALPDLVLLERHAATDHADRRVDA